MGQGHIRPDPAAACYPLNDMWLGIALIALAFAWVLARQRPTKSIDEPQAEPQNPLGPSAESVPVPPAEPEPPTVVLESGWTVTAPTRSLPEGKRPTELLLLRCCVRGWLPDLSAAKQDAVVRQLRLQLSPAQFTGAMLKLLKNQYPGEAACWLLADTALALAAGFTNWKAGTDADVVDEFPARALVLVLDDAWDRRVLPERWQAAGGRMIGGRMVALVTDPVWAKVSAFGLPFGPLLAGSGYDTEDVDRTEADRLGIIGRYDPVRAPDFPTVNEDELARRCGLAFAEAMAASK